MFTPNTPEGSSVNKPLFLFSIFLLVATLLPGYVLYRDMTCLNAEDSRQKQLQNFSLISPYIAQMDYDVFIEQQKYYKANYMDLKEKINNSIYAQSKGEYGFYFEDLTSGAWLGINEREEFIPVSLLKVPVTAAVLKKVENGELTLDTNVTILEEDVNNLYGPLGARGCGYNMTVLELMEYTLRYSDNTADLTLARLLADNNFDDALVGLGISRINLNPSENEVYLSPKIYSNQFRTLYYSGYLKRRNSQLILSLLANTTANSGIPAGLPPGIIVSHKIGVYTEPKAYHHDCGIVYLSKRPYILCFMTKGLSQEESDQFIREISRMIYEYVSKIPDI